MEAGELLLEVGTEEIPASILENSAQNLANGLRNALRAQRLDACVAAVYYTPRRMIASITGVPVRQENLTESLIGPPRSVAFDAAGKPTRAAEAFARKAGVSVNKLTITQTPKGEYISAVRTVRGRRTRDILPALIPEAIRSLQFPKTMYWSADKFRFSRPLRWVVALYQGRPVRFSIADVVSGATTSGHRSLGKGRIRVTSASDLVDRLRENGVLADPAARRERIAAELEREAMACGGSLLQDHELLQTVVNLNEYPSVISGRFDDRFLGLPKEILVTVMREHQKYFSVLDREGKLLPVFLAVINLDADRSGKIREGHERVLRARLADAEFFWETDRRHSLESRLESLCRVLFQEKLGSYYDKTQRLLAMLPKLARMAGWDVELENLLTAARLAKCDLVTEMVKEFTDLQGIVGGLYAQAEGRPDEVWQAVYEQYMPKSTASPSPRSRAGALLALADRLDSVCGCISFGLIPTGSKDPFALRRQGNGIIKIILDHGMQAASISELVDWSLQTHGLPSPETSQELRKFLEGRLRFFLEEMGFSYDCLNAAQASGFDRPCDGLSRVKALQNIRAEQDFLSVASNFKRIVNILAQTADGEEEPNPGLFMEPAEHRLREAYELARPLVEAAKARQDYLEVFRILASLRGTVDAFFDQVLVMAPDPALRGNRLALLRALSRTFREVADVSQIVLERD